MNFCHHCGAKLSFRVPPGDTLPRYVCDRCHAVHYENPKIVAGCIPRWENRVLLCRRAIEPRCGLWTIPAGFMENGETTAEAAQRETLEEATAKVAVGPLYALYNLPQINQVYLIFLADLTAPAFAPGQESLEVALFEETDIPWETLAFDAVRYALQRYFSDRRDRKFPFHMGDILHPSGGSGASQAVIIRAATQPD